MPGINDSKCVLVIGATSGIGRALALAIHALPTQPTVIVGGRRKDRLEELVKKGQEIGGRLDAVQIDVTASRETLKIFIDGMISKYPDLDAVVFCSGVQHRTDFTKPEEINLDATFDEININYISIFSMITFLLPHFLKLGSQGRQTFFIPVSSGLAMLPMHTVSNYCATKAALHSLSLSLHANLQGTNVNVMEIIPPLVESELHDHQGTTPMLSKHWMPLDEFTKHVMEGLERGDVNILTPSIKPVWEKFEKDKIQGNAPAVFLKKSD